ncbi:hypothetical protein BDI4_1080029 [Burkholderia diffusa]|nr:hypothetical protein BDI4_1080029 [Burkholderia diffusa]
MNADLTDGRIPEIAPKLTFAQSGYGRPGPEKTQSAVLFVARHVFGCGMRLAEGIM